MQRHVRVQHKFHHQRPELLVLLLGQVLQDIALIVNHRPLDKIVFIIKIRVSFILLEERRHMVVFQDRLVVVQIGQSRPGLDVKIVCGSRVIKVMDYGGEKEREDLQV